ncbi:hypothetical protein [Chengkuizengella axinellae]|uniref:DUF5082 domain-containing protein n=1 Tax=Chengkuizengella axinellae TaxID=3064388 RepID=A0ABT9J6I1_9BACL|nr:hypothetical protein [Chengkuizengella sp. 2205SS18-9]MDP5277205.1 hypothetical protein [Chengkuizengella sp. 2205SS18-9]
MDVERYKNEIIKYRQTADAQVEDNPGALINKIDLLSKCLVYIGRLSSHCDGKYKRIYAQRKHDYAYAEIHSKSPKKANAELAVAALREQEAEAYELMQRWRNAFESTQQEINALKYKLKIDFVEFNNGR